MAESKFIVFTFIKDNIYFTKYLILLEKYKGCLIKLDKMSKNSKKEK